MEFHDSLFHDEEDNATSLDIVLSTASDSKTVSTTISDPSC